jgi:hypothetical protein
MRIKSVYVYIEYRYDNGPGKLPRIRELIARVEGSRSSLFPPMFSYVCLVDKLKAMYQNRVEILYVVPHEKLKKPVEVFRFVS